MKKLKSVLLLAFMAIAIHAQATQYVIIRPSFLWGLRLVYVDKPNNLKKWFYDSKNDIYYRGEDGLGIPAPIHMAADAQATKLYR